MNVAVEVEERIMVKRNDVTMKVDAEVARMAKLVAEYEGKSAAEYVSEVLRPIVVRDLERHSRRFLGTIGDDPPPAKPKRTH